MITEQHLGRVGKGYKESNSGAGCSFRRGGRTQSEILEWRPGLSLAIGLERETYLQASVFLSQMKVIKIESWIRYLAFIMQMSNSFMLKLQ